MGGMRCIYINLDRAPDRRAALEADFQRAAPPGVTLERFAAVDGAALGALPGPNSPAEVGCFLSHRNALASTLGDEAPVFLIEDDVRFSRRCFKVLGTLLKRADWDLLYTELVPIGAEFIVKMATAYPDHVRRGAFRRIDLRPHRFTASSAYVVNGAAKARLVALLDEMGPHAMAYDYALDHLVKRGALRASVVFPFVTTVDEGDGGSQIQAPEKARASFVLNTLRRLFYIDRDMAELNEASEVLRRDYLDDHARLVGEVLGAHVSTIYRMRD